MKILVVDDEPLAAQYIVNCIRESGTDLDVIGYVTSGQKALELLTENPADLVFTDITMPKMNGIELLTEIKTHWPLTDVIMLTCHESFDYVRIALDKHASNYVLKNELSPEKACSIIDEIRKRRIEKHTENVDVQLSRNRFLFQLLQNDDVPAIITEEQLRRNHILLENKAYEILVFFRSENDLNRISTLIRQNFDNLQYIVYETNNIFLLANLSEDKGNWMRSRSTEGLRKYSDELNGLYGVSSMHNNILEIREALNEALADRDRYFYRKSEVPQKANQQLASEQMIAKIYIMMEDGRIASVCSLIEEYLADAEERRLRTDILIEGCRQILKKFSTVSNDLTEEMIQRLYSFNDFQILRDYVMNICGRVAEKINRYTPSIQKALDYIDDHYAEDISLNSTAEHVFLHRDYLSRQFKKEVGINFSEYLNDVRLNHAKILLESTNMRISDIAVSIGIPNLSYFSTIFSRKFGASPASFRNGK